MADTDALATVDELVARCDWDLDADELRAAQGNLEEASDLVRAYGRNWTPENCPRLAKNIAISAVRRYMRNPDGFVQSRAGDEMLTWRDAGENSATIFLTKAELKLLRDLAGTAGIQTAGMSAWGPQRPRRVIEGAYGTYSYGYETPVGWVPVSGYDGEQPFPLYASPSSPW